MPRRAKAKKTKRPSKTKLLIKKTKQRSRQERPILFRRRNNEAPSQRGHKWPLGAQGSRRGPPLAHGKEGSASSRRNHRNGKTNRFGAEAPIENHSQSEAADGGGSRRRWNSFIGTWRTVRPPAARTQRKLTPWPLRASALRVAESRESIPGRATSSASRFRSGFGL